jgi:glycosyltransferase involved in cell wall biosynthesis
MRLEEKNSIKKKENNFLISVVTVVFNGERDIEATIQSVLNQDDQSIEYIVIDGGSTDGTLDIIRKYEHMLTFWISEKDEGVYDAMNKGLTFAKGDLIHFLNAGDVYFPNSLSIIFNSFNNKFKVAKYKVIVENGLVRNEFATSLYFGRRMLNHQGLVYKKSVFDNNKFDKKLKIIGDLKHLLEFDLWKDIYYIDETIVTYKGDGLATQRDSIFLNYFERIKVFKWKRVDLRVRLIVFFFAIVGVLYNFFLKKNKTINGNP